MATLVGTPFLAPMIHGMLVTLVPVLRTPFSNSTWMSEHENGTLTVPVEEGFAAWWWPVFSGPILVYLYLRKPWSWLKLLHPEFGLFSLVHGFLSSTSWPTIDGPSLTGGGGRLCAEAAS